MCGMNGGSLLLASDNYVLDSFCQFSITTKEVFCSGRGSAMLKC